MTAIQYDRMRRLIKRAVLGGAKRRSMTLWEWDVAGDCESSVAREVWSRPPADVADNRLAAKARKAHSAAEAARIFGGDYSWVPPYRRPKGVPKTIVVSPETQGLLSLLLHVRCRTCSKCRKVRSRMWYWRAMTEAQQAHRTWFGTITLNPDANHASLTRARKKMRLRGVIWEEMTPMEQFTELHKQNGLHLQLWLKRVRKESKATLRFLLVCEAHKSGLPHYHVLVHEQHGSAPVLHRVLSDQWKLGFTNFKLMADVKQAGYLCKYLAKDARARVRASANYGKRSVAIGLGDHIPSAPKGVRGNVSPVQTVKEVFSENADTKRTEKTFSASILELGEDGNGLPSASLSRLRS